MIQKFFILFISSLLLSPLDVSATYAYPVTDQYKATFLSATTDVLVSRAFKAKLKSVLVPSPFPQREELAFIGERAKAHVNLAFHRGKKAPLVFVMGGLGATQSSGTSMFYQQALYKAGMHSISIPSPFHWAFNLSHFPQATPGYSELDSLVLYDFMKEAVRLSEEIYGVEISEFYLSGYSMGGLQAIFVAELDQKQKYFNFKKVLAINPPIDLYESATKLDLVFPAWKTKSARQQRALQSKVFNYLLNMSIRLDGRILTKEDLFEIISSLPFTTDEYKTLIGFNFLETLANTIFSSELVNAKGYIYIDRKHYSPQPALNQAREFKFIDYFNQILFPTLIEKDLGVPYSRKLVVSEMGLLGKEQFLREAQYISVYHNQDDIIVSPESLEKLKNFLPESRIKIYPRGGHLGNVWYPDNILDFVGYFLKPLT